MKLTANRHEASLGLFAAAELLLKTSVSETIRKPPLVIAQTALRNQKKIKYGEKRFLPCDAMHSDTIRYDSVYLTCSKKLTGSQLSLPHGTNKKIKMQN